MARKEEIERIARNYENKIIENNPGAESYDYMNAVIYGAEWADNYWQNRFNKFDLTSKGRLYTIWLGIKSRCNNKNNIGYYRYGGRGISICDSWDRFFINFAIWAIFNGYEDNLSIDRIDVDGNYCPENCRWADVLTQMNNTSRNYIINDDTIGELARKYNINYRTLHNRITRGGMSIEEAITCKKAYRYKPVCQYDLNGIFIKEYPSARVAAQEIFGEYNETIRKRIVAVCYGKAKSTMGFIFKYKERIA